jgi:hypothetical protein
VSAPFPTLVVVAVSGVVGHREVINHHCSAIPVLDDLEFLVECEVGVPVRVQVDERSLVRLPHRNPPKELPRITAGHGDLRLGGRPTAAVRVVPRVGLDGFHRYAEHGRRRTPSMFRDLSQSPGRRRNLGSPRSERTKSRRRSWPFKGAAEHDGVTLARHSAGRSWPADAGPGSSDDSRPAARIQPTHRASRSPAGSVTWIGCGACPLRRGAGHSSTACC